jgi:hypothetical protein
MHTCAFSSAELILPVVLVGNKKLVQLTRNVVCCTSIRIPIGINTI